MFVNIRDITLTYNCVRYLTTSWQSTIMYKNKGIVITFTDVKKVCNFEPS